MIQLEHEFNRVAIESRLKKFVVRSQSGFWGSGDSIKKAKAVCLKAGARKNDAFDCHWGDETLEVLSSGMVQAKHALLYIGQV